MNHSTNPSDEYNPKGYTKPLFFLVMEKENIIHKALLSIAKHEQAVTQINEAIHTLQQENWALRQALLSLRNDEV